MSIIMTGTGTSSYSTKPSSILRESPSEETESLLVRTGSLRTVVDGLSEDIKEGHHTIQRHDLESRTAVEIRKGTSTLLQKLSEEYGVSWANIARISGVSVSAVRKWRQGSPSRPEHRKALAAFSAFLDLLGELSVEEPEVWMEIEFPLPDGYSIRPIELYLNGHVSELLDIACARRRATDVLDEIQPDWRNTRRGNLRTYLGPDNNPVLSPAK